LQNDSLLEESEDLLGRLIRLGERGISRLAERKRLRNLCSDRFRLGDSLGDYLAYDRRFGLQVGGHNPDRRGREANLEPVQPSRQHSEISDKPYADFGWDQFMLQGAGRHQALFQPLDARLKGCTPGPRWPGGSP